MATKVQDFLKANPQYVGRANVPVAKMPVKQTGKGGTLSSMISELGGAGGAWGGAALGASIGSVVPGVGTVIGGLLGAGIGGFAGGTAGRGVENKIRDNQNFFGKGGSAESAFKEGAISGALGAAGEGFQLLKAGKAATGTKGLKNVGKNLIAGAEAKQAGIRSVGAIENMGKSVKSGGMGLAQGAQAKGIAQIGAGQSDAYVKALADAGIKVGAPETMQRALEPKLAKLGEELATKYAKANVPVASTEINALGNSILDKVVTQGGLDKTAENFAIEQVNRMTKSKDLAGLWQFTKDLEKNAAGLAKGTTGSATAKEATARIIKEDIRSYLNSKVPALAETNGKYHILQDTDKLLRKASANTRFGGLGNRIMGLAPVKSAEAKVGSGLEMVGRGINSTPSKLAVGIGARGITNSITATPPVEDPAQYDQALSDLGMTPDMGGGQDMTQGQQMQQPQQQAELYPAQNMMQDIQRDFQATGGKNVDKYLSLYKALSAVTQAQGKANNLNVTKPTSEKFANAQSGLNSLNQYQQLLQQDPSILTKSATPGRSLPVVGGYISRATGTGTSDALAYDMMDNLLRIRTGAQANPAEIKNYVTKMLPRAGDSQATVQRKLAIFRNTFGEILNLAGAQDQNSTLQDAILNAGGSM